MAQTQKEILRDQILLKMHPVLDSMTMDMLNNAVSEALYNVDVVEMQTLPATRKNTNEYIFELFQLRKAPKLSERTVAFYLDQIKHFCDFTNKSLLDITDMDVDVYLQQYRRKGNNPRTVNNALKSISAFFTWMRQAHIVLENPCESVEKYKEIEKPIDHMND